MCFRKASSSSPYPLTRQAAIRYESIGLLCGKTIIGLSWIDSYHISCLITGWGELKLAFLKHWPYLLLPSLYLWAFSTKFTNSGISKSLFKSTCTGLDGLIAPACQWIRWAVTGFSQVHTQTLSPSTFTSIYLWTLWKNNNFPQSSQIMADQNQDDSNR